MMCKHTPMSFIEIWQPRYRDKTVLIAVRKVGTHNKIVFTKAPSMGTEPYYASGALIKKGKKESNGSIDCYVVKLDDLTPLELSERCEHQM